MDIDQIRHFVAVAKTGSFASASEQGFISRSAISKSISKLEAELGSELFVRQPNGVSLTERGSSILPYALDAIKAFDKLESMQNYDRRTKVGVRIGFSFGTFSFFSEAIAAFQSSNPEFTVETFPIDSDRIAELLLNDELDICCGDLPDRPSSLRSKVVLRPQVLYGVPAGSKAAKDGCLPRSELQKKKLLGPKSGKSATFVCETSDGVLSKEQLNKDYIDSDDMDLLFNYVRNGIGYLGMPEGLTFRYRLDDIVFVPSKPRKYWEITVFYKEGMTKNVKLALKSIFSSTG